MPWTLPERSRAVKRPHGNFSVTESGFEKLPDARRVEAFRMNDGGWSTQLRNIEKHVAGS